MQESMSYEQRLAYVRKGMKEIEHGLNAQLEKFGASDHCLEALGSSSSATTTVKKGKHFIMVSAREAQEIERRRLDWRIAKALQRTRKRRLA